VLKLAIALILGTVFYLYKIHKNKESYALNLMLTAFVTRVTGVEFLQAVSNKLTRMKYHIINVIYKNTFINKPIEEKHEESEEEEG
jgi:hypothetical protein